MTPLLVLSFIGTAFICFVVVFIVTRPSGEEKAVDKRLAGIKAQSVGFERAFDPLQALLKPAEPGQFAWLEELFENAAFVQKLKTLMMQANKTTSVGMVLMTCIGIGAVAAIFAYMLTGMLAIAAPAGLVLSYAPVALLRIQRARRIAKFNGVLADCIDMMSRSLRAGHSLVGAIGIVAEEGAEPAKSEFGEVFKKQNYGLPLRDALMQLLERVPSQDLRVLVTGMMVQKDTGGNLVDILDRIVHVIRERIRIKGEIKTHTAQGRMTGWILCALPIVMLFMINVVNPGYSNVLFHDPLGQKMLYAGIMLLCVGGFVIRNIINGIEV